MLPDVAAIDKVFDYSVPAELDADVRLGTLVRVELQGRRVGGWVVDADRPPTPGLAIRPIKKVTGWGPPPPVVDLASWAAWRWAGRRASFLSTASPPAAVRGLPHPPAPRAPTGELVDPESPLRTPTPVRRDEARALARSGLQGGVRLVRVPPAADLLAFALEATERGAALILHPSTAAAARLATRLRAAGIAVAVHPREWAAARAGGCTVVGSRAAAWAPVPELSAVVVLDAHDEAYQEERAPTWHARDVAIERARRTGVPCLVVSPCPDLATIACVERGRVDAPQREHERNGWPALDVIDRRADDPRTGLFSPRLVDALHRHDRVVCVLNRKGRARLLACVACRELARCERCQAAVAQDERGLRCARCGTIRPALCALCGATKLKSLRVGVTRAREELEALAGRPVQEVVGETAEPAVAAVLIGTEAVLHRAGRADAVVFLDFDQELLAPRYRAAEQALAMLARAARLVGGRRGAGRVLVQTRLPGHEVLDAALHGDPARVVTAEATRRAELRLPPTTALAALSGPAAGVLAARLTGIEVQPADDGSWLVRAPSAAHLADALAAAGRPPGRLRIEVDPLRI